MSDFAPLVITVAPNGARKTRTDHSAIPITPVELAREAQRCWAAGAAMIHLHVRGDHNEHSLDAGRYRAAIEAIRGRIANGMIIQLTTEAVGVYSAAQQMAMVRELKPEAVSLAIRELCPEGLPVDEVARFFSWMESKDVSPQYILYSTADVKRFCTLREQGVIPGVCPSVLYVLGRYGGGDSSPEQLSPLLEAMRGEVIWSVCAFGSTEAECMLRAAELGGHCRVGFENNMQLSSGETAPNNASLITQLAEKVKVTGRAIASTEEARQLFGMNRHCKPG